jgi:cytochrome c peroxidase
MKHHMIICLIVSMLLGCNGEAIAPGPFGPYIPCNFPDPEYTFENNKITRSGFELGRMLFYDPILSVDSSIACVSCHQQVSAFSDPVHRLSKGVKDRSGLRNAPPIQNIAFQRKFLWDGGVNHLDFVPINAITSEVEMAENLTHVVKKLSRNERYRNSFQEAFGNLELNSQQLLHALSQFMVMMVSAESRYDQYMRQEGGQLSADEHHGLKLFRIHCSSCHATELFTDGSFRNNGLDESFARDSGRARITERPEDRGKFKVPSLRNIELTAPYMHDGRIKTLEAVLDHYRHGIVDSETLDPLLKENYKLGITVSENEKSQIVAFLKTLTDRNFTADQRFSNPFPQ